MNPLEQKARIQKRSVEISKDYNALLLSFATGTGKTLTALKIAQDKKGKWLILCKEINHINEWKKEITKHKVKLNYEIMCYSSLHKVKGKYNIICDEAHAITVKRRNLIRKNIQYDNILFLTATLPDNKRGHIKLLSKDRKYKELPLPLNKAIKLGILPEPQINVHYVEMTKLQRLKYEKIDSSVKQASFNYNDHKTQKAYESLMFISNRRKNIVANFKLKAVRKLLEQLDRTNKRYICFTNSIKQLSYLCNSDSYIHSQREKAKDKNIEVIENFNAGKYNHIFTVKMLTESANLANIQEGIIVQLDTKQLTALQKIGRVLRSYLPVMHIFIVRDTMDEYYLESSLQDVDKKFINYYGI